MQGKQFALHGQNLQPYGSSRCSLVFVIELVRKQAHENRAQQPAPESIPRDDVALLVSRETAQPHPVSNRHLRWWGGSTLTTAEMEGPRAAMVTALVRAFNTDAQ